MRRSHGAALITLLGVLAILAAQPALAQTSTDTPGGCLHQVVNELAGPAAPSGVSLWSAISYAVQQQLALGLWRWVPLNTDPMVARVSPNLLVPRRPWARVGILSRP